MPLLSPTEAARRLGLTRQRVNQLVAAGEIPAQWIGSQRGIEVADLEDYEQRRRERREKPRENQVC